MRTSPRCLAVIPARGGSKGLPNKNLRLLCGRPLIAHSLAFASLVSEFDRTIVSTDSTDIAEVTRAYGGDVPFLRPSELAEDNSPMLPVLAHAIEAVETEEERPYELVALLDPTSPGRLPEYVTVAVSMLANNPEAVGILSISVPRFNPIWVSVVERSGAITPAFEGTRRYTRRQDVPSCYRINGALNLWRRDWLLSHPVHWIEGHHLGLEMPEQFAISIDDQEELDMAELLISNGHIHLPWLASGEGRNTAHSGPGTT